MNKFGGTLKVLGLVGLFIFSFFFFLYFTFPYGVLKEAITASINKELNVNIHIGELEPDFPLGLEAKDVKVFSEKGRKSLQIDSATVSISLLRFLIGQLHADVVLGSKNGGELELGMSFGLITLLTGGEKIPGISIEADGFAVDGMLDFFLSSMSSAPGVSPLLQPVLNQIKLTGNLQGRADIDVDLADPQASAGDLDLSLAGGKLVIDDPGLNIVPQNFSKFIVRAKMDNGSLVIDKASGVETQELKVDLNGRVSFNKVLEASALNVNLTVELQDGLKENFGLIVELAMGGKDGRGRIQVAGTLGNPAINKM